MAAINQLLMIFFERLTTDANGNLYAAGWFTNDSGKYYVAEYKKPFPPSITSISPKSACPNTTVTIKGKGFTGATLVIFGNDKVSNFTVLTDTSIFAVIDTGSGGTVQVATDSGTATLNGFIWLSASSSTSTAIICNGSPFTFNGKSYDSAGTYSIHLTTGEGCNSVAVLVLSVVAPDTLQPIIGDSVICKNTSTTLTDATVGGIWSSNDSTVASVKGGVVTGVNTNTATITYTDTVGCPHATTKQIQVVGIEPQVDSVITQAT